MPLTPVAADTLTATPVEPQAPGAETILSFQLPAVVYPAAATLTLAPVNPTVVTGDPV